VIADEVLGSREKHDRNFLKKFGKKLNGGLRVPCMEGTSNSTVALCPSNRLLHAIDMESASHLRLPQVGGQVHQIRRPVHTTARVGVLESYVVHVDACVVAVALLGQLEHIGENSLALSIIHMTSVRSHHLFTAAPIGLELLVVVGVLLDKALLNSVCNVSGILFGWRDPAVADQESLQVPCGFGVLLVAI
jgi:hypothetical protein